ncbi:MAG: DUF861 domain-containing protein [Alphaproteobacteria bacterium]|nr:MAG: DUF861 domain-containing protein [Alphaproteobacteria bacterium]
MQHQIPTVPDTVTRAALDAPDGWMDYPLGSDVIAGEPNCRMKLLRTVGTVTPYKAVAFFTADPSVFTWRFDNDEAFVILEGHIAITLDTGERVEMKAGDAVSFPGGHTGTCEVFVPTRKFTVVTNGQAVG